MPTPLQNIKITYGDLSVGKDSEDDHLIVMGYNVREGRLDGDVSFQVLVMGDDTDDLQDKCIAFSTAFRKRRQRLIIETDGKEHYDFDPSTTINKNLVAECTQNGQAGFRGKTRLFDVNIKLTLPPSESNGRTETSVSLTTGCNGVHTLSISAQYNSTLAGTAKALMEADFPDYVADVQESFASIDEWEFQSGELQSEDILTNEMVTVTRHYMEVHHNVSVTYGDFTVGDSGSSYRVLGAFQMQLGRLTGSIGVNVRVRSTTAGGLNALCETLEEAYREQRKEIDIDFGGANHRTFGGTYINKNSQATSTAQDNDCSSGAQDDDGYFKRDYALSIEVDMPPRESHGRTEETVQVAFTANRYRRITLHVAYNSTSSGGAYSLYEADIDTHSDTVLAFFGGDTDRFELIDESFDEIIPVLNNRIGVTRTYQELTLNQSLSILNDADFYNLDFSLSIDREAPGDLTPRTIAGSSIASSGGSGASSSAGQSVVVGTGGTVGLSDGSTIPRRLIRATVTVTTEVLKTNVDLKGLVTSKILPYAKQIVIAQLNAKMLGRVAWNFSPNLTGNRFTTTITYEVSVMGNGQLLEYRITVSSRLNPGKRIVGYHDQKKFTKRKIEVKATRTRTVTIRKKVVGLQVEPSYLTIPVDNGTGWITTDGPTESPVAYRIGPIGDTDSFDITEYEISEEQEWIEAPKNKAPVTLAGLEGRYR